MVTGRIDAGVQKMMMALMARSVMVDAVVECRRNSGMMFF